MKCGLAFLLTVLLLSGCGSAPPVALAPPPPLPAPVMAEAPAFAASAPSPQTWHGGVVRELGVTSSKPFADSGYGLYVYQLPGTQVRADVLAAIEHFNCAELHPVLASEHNSQAVALMVLPVYQTSLTAGVPHIDLSLSADFLNTAITDPDPTAVYIVITGTPIRDLHRHLAGTSFFAIKLGFLAPPFVENWLSRLRQNIEQDNITSPRALDLKLRSVFWQIGSAGELIGVNPAYAASPETACQ